jgi:hypothetical protein
MTIEHSHALTKEHIHIGLKFLLDKELPRKKFESTEAQPKVIILTKSILWTVGILCCWELGIGIFQFICMIFALIQEVRKVKNTSDYISTDQVHRVTE